MSLRVALVSLPLLALGLASCQSEPPYGLLERPLNETCHSFARPDSGEENALPALLSETGCFDPADPSVPVEALIPYAINAPFWSDGALKLRYLAVPDGETIDVGSDGDFFFPVGSVIVKTFEYDDQPVFETRLLVHHTDGWAGYSYVWNEDGTDAELLGDTPLDRQVGDVLWTYPTTAQCTECHVPSAGFTLGPEAAQLNRDLEYPSGVVSNQLDTLAYIGLIAGDRAPSENQAAYPDPTDESHSLEERARSWLHTNCASCHHPDGPTTSPIDLRYSTFLGDTGTCDVAPAIPLVPEKDLLIAPGEPDRSWLLERIRNQTFRMPPLASRVIEEDGAQLIEDWIASMEGCQPGQ